MLIENQAKLLVKTLKKMRLHLSVHVLTLVCRSIVEEAMQCKKKILQNDGVVTSPCARPRKAGHTLLILGGQTFMCDKIYQVKHIHTVLYTCMTYFHVWQDTSCAEWSVRVWLGLKYLFIHMQCCVFNPSYHPWWNVIKWEALAQLHSILLTVKRLSHPCWL